MTHVYRKIIAMSALPRLMSDLFHIEAVFLFVHAMLANPLGGRPRGRTTWNSGRQAFI